MAMKNILPEIEKEPVKTKSICPVCHKILDALIFEENKKIWIEKECPEHGKTKELYWGDSEMYDIAKKYRYDGTGIDNSQVKQFSECPYSCGLCPAHKSHTILGIIYATNRCNLRCSYCFANAAVQGFIYEPDIRQIESMLKTLRNNRPVPVSAVMFSGGEPSLRGDMTEIISLAKNMGFSTILFNTNGTIIAQKPELIKEYKDAGATALYLSFDGLTSKTNPKNHQYTAKIIEECRKVNLPVVLVPTIINGVNDHEIGDIVKYAAENIDIIKAVNFQPISFIGSMAPESRVKQRITIPDVIKKINEQTDGQIKKDSFFPVPSVLPISKILESSFRRPHAEFSAHPHCGMGTYVFAKDKKIIPITDFLDVRGLYSLLDEISKEDLYMTHKKVIYGYTLHQKIKTLVDHEKKPFKFSIVNTLVDLLTKGVIDNEFTRNSLFIGMMHFQDAYNYDIERVKRCVIHYATPDNRIIPFCAFNVLPELYRDKIHKKYSTDMKTINRR